MEIERNVGPGDCDGDSLDGCLGGGGDMKGNGDWLSRGVNEGDCEGCLRGGTVDWLGAGDDEENRDCEDCDWLIWVRNGGGN